MTWHCHNVINKRLLGAIWISLLCTMLATATLDRIVHEMGINDPGLILQQLNEHVRRSLHQQGSSKLANDGMDIALCNVNLLNRSLQYAGAKISLY